MPLLGSPGCEWLQWLAVFCAHWWCLFLALQYVSGCVDLPWFEPDKLCPWLFRKWVAVMPYCVSFSLMAPLVLQFVSGYLAMLQACWWCLSLPLQRVGWLDWFAIIEAHWHYLYFSLKHVSGHSALSADYIYPLFSSLWVAAVACCILNLLITPFLGSSESEWSAFCILRYAENACPLLSSQSVATVSYAFLAC